ncbi:hypothetical protein [Nostoc sp. PA-18-2419]|uniref:hypothetical protein n=1 Tax=Nostoc sp. PA-18-2419 TaxID=2575443 RepID=UPI0011099D79|nr:hypothetical protein [Nostoc sp. PA-18-2419]
MRENCQFCNGEFRLKVTCDRRTKTRYLRDGHLLKNFSGGQVASVLLQVKANVKALMGVTNA